MNRANIESRRLAVRGLLHFFMGSMATAGGTSLRGGQLVSAALFGLLMFVLLCGLLWAERAWERLDARYGYLYGDPADRLLAAKARVLVAEVWRTRDSFIPGNDRRRAVAFMRLEDAVRGEAEAACKDLK